MTTLIPSSQTEAYEDMFKEITKKLYGEEASQSLHTPIAHITPDVERSFTNLLTDRNLTSNDFDHGVGIDNISSIKNDDHLTAFGIALMQNGFPTTNALLNSHTFQQITKQNQASASSPASNNLSASSANINTVQGHSASESMQENTWNPKSESYQHTQKYYKSKKHEASNNHSNVTLKSTNDLNSNGSGSANQTPQNGNNGQNTLLKRYNCTNCHYASDRRDLFKRHENIHSEDKPFQCYVCLKTFSRADHVKKHFLRMHRGLNYDIGRTKRSQPQTKLKKSNSSSGAAFYNTNTSNHVTNLSIPATYHSTLQNHHQQIEQPSQTSIIDQTNQHLGSTFHGNSGTVSNHQSQSNTLNIKVEKKLEKTTKKTDKRFICCYCSWSGNDNWGLKRHLNTHTKPFVCILCDYKAARSERLATHVFKVHNKKVCTKCNYLAENQSEYDAHVNDTHANETRTQRSSHATNSSESRSPANNVLRNINSSFSGSNSLNPMTAASSSHAFDNWRSMVNANSVNSPSATKSNGNSSGNQKRGAERLFQYFGADDSDPEDYARQLQMAAISRNTASVAQDFHNAGGGKNARAQNANNQMTGNSISESCKHNQYTEELAIEFLDSIDCNYNAISKMCVIHSDRKCREMANYDHESIGKQRVSPPANLMLRRNFLSNTSVFQHCGKENTMISSLQFQKRRLAMDKDTDFHTNSSKELQNWRNQKCYRHSAVDTFCED